MDKISIGIDVAKWRFDITVWIDRKQHKAQVVPNTHMGLNQLLKWLSPYSNVGSVLY